MKKIFAALFVCLVFTPSVSLATAEFVTPMDIMKLLRGSDFTLAEATDENVFLDSKRYVVQYAAGPVAGEYSLLIGFLAKNHSLYLQMRGNDVSVTGVPRGMDLLTAETSLTQIEEMFFCLKDQLTELATRSYFKGKRVRLPSTEVCAQFYDH